MKLKKFEVVEISSLINLKLKKLEVEEKWKKFEVENFKWAILWVREGFKKCFEVYSCSWTTFISYSSFNSDFWFWLTCNEGNELWKSKSSLLVLIDALCASGSTAGVPGGVGVPIRFQSLVLWCYFITKLNLTFSAGAECGNNWSTIYKSTFALLALSIVHSAKAKHYYHWSL